MLLALDALNRDEGTVVVFEGFDPAHPDTGRYLVAFDHRSAQDILAMIEQGEAPVCQVESWQMLGRIIQKIDRN